MFNPFKKNKKEASQVASKAAEGSPRENSMNERTENTRRVKPELDPNKAHIYNLIIVDESGSMSRLREVTISGINETIGTIKQAQKEFADAQQHFLTLVTFDTRHNDVPPVRIHLDAVPIDSIDGFTDYMPHGCTPLFDAMGQSLTRLHNEIKDDENATAVVTVITDGMENSSREWRGSMVKQLVERLKDEGWTFSYMGSTHDVRSVSAQLSIEHFLEFDHDDVGASSSWHRDMSSKRAHYRKMANDFDARESRAFKRAKFRAHASSYFENRITPNMVDHLEPNEVFVFGSNEQGQHLDCASAYAVEHFGAVMGQAEGPQGQSYAIPTYGTFDQIAQVVGRFIDYAHDHPDQRFLVTRLACVNPNCPVDLVARLFINAVKVENICLTEEFWMILGLKMF